jgi:FAD/FMN-containing dehydrogenase
MTQLAPEALRDLETGFSGSIIQPHDDAYDDARRVFNGMIDRRPALVVRPADTPSVQKAVRFARDRGLAVSVKGGGHSAAGHAVVDDGLMIDLSLIKEIKIDPEARTAVVGGGVTWGELDAATQAHGLAVTGGRISSTGVGGLTLGSGSGWLERKLGYTVDNMLSAEVVTAEGEVLRASENENSDLFWGLRGGGGNYAIVTKFEFRLHPIGPIIYGGMLGFPRDPAVLKAYRDFMDTAPDDVGGAASLITAPPEEFVPPAVRGMPVMGIVVCYTGAPEDGERAFKPILDLSPVLQMTGPMPYVELQKLLDAGNPPGLRNYWKADMYPELPDEAVDRLLDAAAQPLSPFTTLIIQPIGGAVHRVPDDATAMGWRRAKWALHVLGMWEDPADDEANIAWVRNVQAALAPYAMQGTYLNYLMDEGTQRVAESFGPHYDRMVELKNKYDPTNFFRFNQNIRPTV